MHRFLIIIVLILVLFTACSSNNVSKSSYPAVVAWNYVIYGLSIETVPSDKIGFEIGQVKRTVSAMPEKNGDSNIASVGSKLYTLKNISTEKAIVVKIDGKYYKAYKSSRLNQY